jgi:hypothetical protein
MVAILASSDELPLAATLTLSVLSLGAMYALLASRQAADAGETPCIKDEYN